MSDSKQYEIVIIGEYSRDNDNVDVEVVFSNGTRYSATFFTLKNIEQIMARHKETGECKHGLYLWAANMIIVKELSEEVIHQVIEDLIQQDELSKALSILES